MRKKHSAEQKLKEKRDLTQLRSKKAANKPANCKKRYRCSECDSEFVRQDSLKSHVKQHQQLAQEFENTAFNTALAVLQLQTPVTNISNTAPQGNMVPSRQMSSSSVGSEHSMPTQSASMPVSAPAVAQGGQVPVSLPPQNNPSSADHENYMLSQAASNLLTFVQNNCGLSFDETIQNPPLDPSGNHSNHNQHAISTAGISGATGGIPATNSNTLHQQHPRTHTVHGVSISHQPMTMHQPARPVAKQPPPLRHGPAQTRFPNTVPLDSNMYQFNTRTQQQNSNIANLLLQAPSQPTPSLAQVISIAENQVLSNATPQLGHSGGGGFQPHRNTGVRYVLPGSGGIQMPGFAFNPGGHGMDGGAPGVMHGDMDRRGPYHTTGK